MIALPIYHLNASELKILAFGDSLTAGYGLEQGAGFTDQLENALRAEGLDVRVLNGGVSGDTTAGGRARLEWMLGDVPSAVIVELGANDGLRGLDPVETRANLDVILETLVARKIPTLLTGMYAPPNMGSEYATDFGTLYPQLANHHGVLFYPFFLEGVAGDLALNQDDTIHPNQAGVAVIVARILPSVKELLNQVSN